MRPNHKRGYYTKDGAVIHAKKCPEGAREITQDEADALSGAATADQHSATVNRHHRL